MPSRREGQRVRNVVLGVVSWTLDRSGRGVVMDRSGAGAETAAGALAERAAAAGVPLSVQSLDGVAADHLSRPDLVLVRPDGHVAWTGDDLPDDLGRLLATVTGAP